MKKNSFIFLCIAFLWVLGCHKNENANPPSEAIQKAEENAPNSLDKTQAQPESDDMHSDESVKNIGNADSQKIKDPQNHYTQRPHLEIPFPHLNDVAVPPVRSESNDSKSRVMYLYENDNFMKNYQQQLIEAGFEKKTEDVYLKMLDSLPLIVKMTQGEGEYWIEMMTTRDPENRYQHIPDKNIPYPLENHIFAAEYADVQLPNEASNETVYIYYQRMPSFVTDYENLLKAAGFENVRVPESPFYTKQTDRNIEFSVAIEKMNDTGTDVRIKMMSIRMEAN